MPTLLHNARLYGAHELSYLLIDGDEIVHIGIGDPLDYVAPDAERLDLDGGIVLPGFIDMHVHGSHGADTMDATPDAIITQAKYFASRGVTSFLATTMTQSHDAVTAALHNAAGLVGRVPGGAQLLGVHLEGPYINRDARGAQSGDHVRVAEASEYASWLDLNVIRETTVAPEFAENADFITACRDHGVVVSIGHTKATYEQAIRSFDHGITQATHTYNAMTGLHHRNPGVVGAVLTDNRVYCELIFDLFHVHPAAGTIAVRAKGIDRMILITDAIRAAGLPDGDSELGGQRVIVKDQHATLADGTLAGSVLTYDQGVRHLLHHTRIPITEAWPMFSLNAARQLGLDAHKGRIELGYDADLVVLHPESLEVQKTFVGGAFVFDGFTAR